MKLQYNPGVPINNRCLSVLSAISTELCIDLLFQWVIWDLNPGLLAYEASFLTNWNNDPRDT